MSQWKIREWFCGVPDPGLPCYARYAGLEVPRYRQNMNLLLGGVAIGIIIFQSAVIAPVIAKTLEPPFNGQVLRSLWPKFFLILVGIGAVFTLTNFLSEPKQFFLNVLSGIFVVGCPLLAYLIIPATNRARDAGDDRSFNWLHRMSVILTVLLLLSYIAAGVLTLS